MKALSLLAAAVLPLQAQTASPALGRGSFNGLKARVTAIRFFEGGGTIPDSKSRVVTTRFDAFATRFIDVELELEYPKASRQTDFQVACRFEAPGTEPREALIKGKVEPGWTGSYHAAGAGSGNRGSWSEGTYRVTCTEEGQVVASTAIEVLKRPPAVAALGATLTHFKFYQSLGERMPIESRRYGTRFDARFARWIKLEFGLSYPALAAAVSFTVECAFRFPDGTSHPLTLSRRAQAGWTISVLSTGLGADRPGSWPNGSYQVSCRNEGKEFASGGFEVFGAGAPPPVATALVPGTRLRFSPGPGISGDAFDAGSFDSLFAEAAVPARLAGDSTEFACMVTDPAGIPTPFRLGARLADKSVIGTGAVVLPGEPRMRGKYRVECRSGTRISVAERFELTGKPDLPVADARVLGTALYEGSDETPDDESAAGTSFRAPEVRSFWVEALLDHPSETTPGDLPVSCRIVDSKKATVADTGNQSLPVDPGERWILFRQRLTILPRKKWIPGRYTLTCAGAGVTFLTLGFDLTR